jgi:hypothetical protein
MAEEPIRTSAPHTTLLEPRGSRGDWAAHQLAFRSTEPAVRPPSTLEAATERGDWIRQNEST